MKIEHNIPTPKAREHSANLKALAQMKVGDSILFTKATSNQVRSKFHYAVKKTGYKVTIRTTEDGVRLWRIQ
jgi:hypothetical protein